MSLAVWGLQSNLRFVVVVHANAQHNDKLENNVAENERRAQWHRAMRRRTNKMKQ
jgi:hypothetical protein